MTSPARREIIWFHHRGTEVTEAKSPASGESRDPLTRRTIEREVAFAGMTAERSFLSHCLTLSLVNIFATAPQPTDEVDFPHCGCETQRKNHRRPGESRDPPIARSCLRQVDPGFRFRRDADLLCVLCASVVNLSP
jgi:hypothetical protein